jgi:hypothetical protein
MNPIHGNHTFTAWFSGSVVTDETGLPLVVWRGEHGIPCDEPWQCRLGALSFGSREAACIYATDPNDHRELPAAPRVTPVYLSIRNPASMDADDPFLDLSVVASAIGRAEALAIALRLSDHVTATNNWEENFAGEWGGDLAAALEASPERLDELYLPAYHVYDDHEAVKLFVEAGYDGAVHGGMGATHGETEWRIFDPSRAVSALSPHLDLPDTFEEPRRLAA